MVTVESHNDPTKCYGPEFFTTDNGYDIKMLELGYIGKSRTFGVSRKKRNLGVL